MTKHIWPLQGRYRLNTYVVYCLVDGHRTTVYLNAVSREEAELEILSRGEDVFIEEILDSYNNVSSR